MLTRSSRIMRAPLHLGSAFCEGSVVGCCATGVACKRNLGVHMQEQSLAGEGVGHFPGRAPGSHGSRWLECIAGVGHMERRIQHIQGMCCPWLQRNTGIYYKVSEPPTVTVLVCFTDD